MASTDAPGGRVDALDRRVPFALRRDGRLTGADLKTH
jgi:hypothetical protein